MTTNETTVEQVRNQKNYGMVIPQTQGQTPMVYTHLGIDGAPPETLQGYALNDAGNARRFLDVYGDDVRYCAAEKQWYICQGDMSWKPDQEQLVDKLAYESVYQSYANEVQFYSTIDRFGQMQQTIGKLEKGMNNIGNLPTLKNCIGMAQKDVPITPDVFDRHNALFHTPNGTVDVDAFVCMDTRKEHYITRTAGAAYNCEAECPRWEQFVMECAEGDAALYRYLQKAAAYSILSGEIAEQAVFCLLGNGKNGKSLFINTLAEIAGDYACKIDSSIISMSRRGDKDHDVSKELYRMRGSRFVYTSEFNKNTVLNEALIKSITDGGKISCRPLYGASIEYQPTYTLWFSTNNAPELVGFDEGIQRRFVLIPFEHYVEHADKTLPDIFRTEASGILNWLMEGYQMYKREGLEKPDGITQATRTYMAEQDVFQMFVDEYYERDATGREETGNVFHKYESWCNSYGEKPIGRRKFCIEMKRLGITHEKSGAKTYYGLRNKQIA